MLLILVEYKDAYLLDLRTPEYNHSKLPLLELRRIYKCLLTSLAVWFSLVNLFNCGVLKKVHLSQMPFLND